MSNKFKNSTLFSDFGSLFNQDIDLDHKNLNPSFRSELNRKTGRMNWDFKYHYLNSTHNLLNARNGLRPVPPLSEWDW